MKLLRSLFFIAIIATIAFFYFDNKSSDVEEISGNVDMAQKEEAINKVSQKKIETHARKDSYVEKKTITEEEYKIPSHRAGESLISYAGIISEFGKKEVRVTDIVNQLKTMGLKPLIANDKSDVTGNMYTVRTKNSLPGARYFHAQVFTDENGKQFTQHMSFEYRPGEKAFFEAVAVAIKEFGLSQNPSVKKEGFYSWNTNDGYVVWVKRMTKEDLKDDPFNAYSFRDIGTIRIAKELEIHGQGESEDHGHIHN